MLSSQLHAPADVRESCKCRGSYFHLATLLTILFARLFVLVCTDDPRVALRLVLLKRFFRNRVLLRLTPLERLQDFTKDLVDSHRRDGAEHDDAGGGNDEREDKSEGGRCGCRENPRCEADPLPRQLPLPSRLERPQEI